MLAFVYLTVVARSPSSISAWVPQSSMFRTQGTSGLDSSRLSGTVFASTKCDARSAVMVARPRFPSPSLSASVLKDPYEDLLDCWKHFSAFTVAASSLPTVCSAVSLQPPAPTVSRTCANCTKRFGSSSDVRGSGPRSTFFSSFSGFSSCPPPPPPPPSDPPGSSEDSVS